MRSTARIACFLALGALAGCASGGRAVVPEGPARIRGRVVGPSGQPLDGVRITTEPETDAVLTFEGEYEITREVKTKSPLSPGVYALRPYKLGWSLARDAGALKVDYPGGDFVVPDLQLFPIVGPTMDDLSAPVERGPEQESQGGGVIRDGE